MLTRKKIIFWAFKYRPSFIMRGIQICEELKKAGLDAQAVYGPSLTTLGQARDSIIVCVKSYPIIPWWIKKNRNLLVYDAIDYSTVRGIPRGIDAVISANMHMQAFFESTLSKRTLVRTIYHHPDQTLEPNQAGEIKLRLVYNGEMNESNFIHGEIPEVEVLSFRKVSNWRKELQRFNAHFSARLNRHKSVIKLANVAKLGAVFLTGAEPGCVELLGEDYPYFLRNHLSLATVREDIETLKHSVGDSKWKMARQKIEDIKDQLSIENSVKEYKKLFDDL